MRSFLISCIVVSNFFIIGCSGEGDIGDSCEVSGDDAECVEEALCTKVVDETLTCLKRCNGQEDCADNEACNGVSGGSGNTCQPKP